MNIVEGNYNQGGGGVSRNRVNKEVGGVTQGAQVQFSA